MRRAGKSAMLYSIVYRLFEEGASWDEITYINFEDERLAQFTAADFDEIVAVQSEMCGGHGYFFFDEIQNVDGWEKFARRLAASRKVSRMRASGSMFRVSTRKSFWVISWLATRYAIRTH
ncbi:hypothetical protein DDD63_04165 [Actinobaculum sp. 313]|nr:hypothetical protein DDD63_04165 [Actinobaculum sp. 313]